MAREDLHFRLRIPLELKARIEEAAQENRRSMTAEIVDRLDRSFDGGFAEHVADTAFFRGIQIGIVETLFMEDDPLAALIAMRERLRRPHRELELAKEADDG